MNYLFAVLWLLLCAASFGALNWYKLKPGPVGKINSFWPQNIPHEHNRTTYNLVLFAHPRCGCTSASLMELEKILVKTKNNLKVKIFFYHPKGESANWSDGESKTMALKLPNTEVYDDDGGEVARRFGAMTSGQTLVYSLEGKLVYAGGITESRGHTGDNTGARSIASVVETGKTIINTQPVFGCVLFSDREMKEYRKP